jgi:hypothetical protein
VQHRVERVVLDPARWAGQLPGELGDEFLQVRTREEHVIDTGDDSDPRRVVVPEATPCLREGLEVGYVQRIARLGPVDGDGRDVTFVTLAGVVDAHAAHFGPDRHPPG